MIEFSPELKNLLTNKGFKNSSQIFMYLEKLGVEFAYDRALISSNTDMNTIIDSYKFYKGDGILFDFESTYLDGSVQLEVILVALMDKQTLIKLINLRAFS